MQPSKGDINWLRHVKREYEEELLQKANVVGVGIGYRGSDPEKAGEPAIIVSVTHKVPRHELAERDLIPDELEGVPVEVRAVGTLRAPRAQASPGTALE